MFKLLSQENGPPNVPRKKETTRRDLSNFSLPFMSLLKEVFHQVRELFELSHIDLSDYLCYGNCKNKKRSV